MPNRRHALGLRAENAVAHCLESLNWQVLERRWRCVAGELDVVCIDPGRRLVGVEVRLRTTARTGTPLESLTTRHRARLRNALVAFARDRRTRHVGLRVDLVAVTPAEGGWRIVRHAGIDGW